ncbi:MAG: helix-turn-helix transcriptional regulator [Rhodoferax sp.]|nr:helix-turn-helix transcriptional regulator [Rhodoferax sp.]
MKLKDQEESEASAHDTLADFPARLAQVLAHQGITQTELARQIGMSPGFISDVMRGHKRPGAEFFVAVRKLFCVSIDWLMTGDGTMMGDVGIRHELLQAIRIQIAVARAAIKEDDPTARALLILIREGQLANAAKDAHFQSLLERIVPTDSDLDLAVELYNGHLGATDPIVQRRNLLAAAVAHFEARKPIDKMAAMTGVPKVTAPSWVQVNTGRGQRIAGNNYIDHRPRGVGKK